MIDIVAPDIRIRKGREFFNITPRKAYDILVLCSEQYDDAIVEVFDTVNLIKRFLCEFTENFAKEYIAPNLCSLLPVEKAFFNYETESFVSNEYLLPFVYDEKGRVEFVLLKG
jgi:hypothetical protein